MSRLVCSIDRTYAAKLGRETNPNLRTRQANAMVNANAQPHRFTFRHRFMLEALEHLVVLGTSSVSIAIWWLIVK